MLPIPEVQAALARQGLDGWLLYDFRGSNPLAHRLLGLAGRPKQSRRLFYFVPRTGEPRKLVHRIERGSLDHLPGEKTVYLSWQELRDGLAALLARAKTVALEYSPEAGNPYVSTVDAGTVELVRACGAEVASSGDLVSRFEATLSAAQRAAHLTAAGVVDRTFARSCETLRDRTANGGTVAEAKLSDLILGWFAEDGCTSCSPPIVARVHHGGDPHYETGSGEDAAIRDGDFLLLDMWCKVDSPDGVYADVTRCYTIGRDPTDREAEVFAAVIAGRDAALGLVRERFAADEPVAGWECDRAARDVIAAAGFGEFFVHRLGHSMGTETTHGNGAHLDDLETRDQRRILPNTCFTIEPGVYTPELGVRSEIDVLISPSGEVRVTGGAPQTRIERIG